MKALAVTADELRASRVATIIVEAAFHDAVKDKRQADACIGYLAMWAHAGDRYHSVRIYCGATGDISALYKDSLGNITYEIFGQMAEDGSYSTHS